MARKLGFFFTLKINFHFSLAIRGGGTKEARRIELQRELSRREWKRKGKDRKKKESEKEMKGETSIHSIIMREIERERYTLDPDCV